MRSGPEDSERDAIIMRALKEQSFITVNELQSLLRVSAATVRRDVARLHEMGSIRKVFGGIAASVFSQQGPSPARPFDENQVINVAAKRAIAAEAVKLCRAGDSIIINGGTTCCIFAEQIKDLSLSVYTNSMPVAASLWKHGCLRLILAGGELYRETGILYSNKPADVEFFASKFFIGAQGINAEGLLESHPLLTPATQQLLERADEVVVLIDSSKFTVRARRSVVPLSRLSTVITDSGLSEADRRMLTSEGIKVVTVSVPDGP